MNPQSASANLMMPILAGVALSLVLIVVTCVFVLLQNKKFGKIMDSLDKTLAEAVAAQEKANRNHHDLQTDLKNIGFEIDAVKRMAKAVEDNLRSLTERLDGLPGRLSNAQTAAQSTREGHNTIETQLVSIRKELERQGTLAAKLTEDRDQFGQERDEANRKRVEAEASLKSERERLGIAPVGASESEIRRALETAVQAVGPAGGSPEIDLARKAVHDEGALLLRSLSEAIDGNVEAGVRLLEGAYFNPFLYSPAMADGAIAAKRTLEAARLAAFERLRSVGFVLVKPEIGRDSFDPAVHDERETIVTDSPLLKGKIAEVRRAGLLYQDRVVRKAKVVQFVVDYSRPNDMPSEPPMNSFSTVWPSTPAPPVDSLTSSERLALATDVSPIRSEDAEPGAAPSSPSPLSPPALPEIPNPNSQRNAGNDTDHEGDDDRRKHVRPW